MSTRVPAIVLRAGIGAAVGWWIVARSAAPFAPGWWTVYVAGVLAVALAVAPGTSRWAGRGITSGWALATSIGIYVGVPETDRMIGVGAAVGVIFLGEVAGSLRVDGFVVALLDIVLVWTAVHGAAGRSGALIAAVATLGLLVVAPLVAMLRAPRRLSSAPWIVPVLLGLQFVFAVGVARLGGVRTTTGEAVRVVVVAVPLLALAVTPIITRGGSARTT